MKAVVFHKHGGPEVLETGEVQDPEVAPDEVLIEVRAASVNHLDIFVRHGLPGLAPPLPHIPGADASGIVRETGSAVTGLEPGQRVTINPGINCGRREFCSAGFASQCLTYRIIGEHIPGTYAELIKVPHSNVLPIPDTMSFEDAAAVPLVFLTAWSMLITKGRIQPGEDVLILGAGAGVGTAAVQIARMMGCRVWAAAGSTKKLDRLADLGAEILINYREEEFDRVIRKQTDKRGVEVVVDYIGADTWLKSLRSVRRGGRILTCGATTGPSPQTDLRHVFFRQLQVLGSTGGSPHEFTDVMRCIFRGQLQPVIDRVLPMSDAAIAHTLIENREVFGKLVLAI